MEIAKQTSPVHEFDRLCCDILLLTAKRDALLLNATPRVTLLTPLAVLMRGNSKMAHTLAKEMKSYSHMLAELIVDMEQVALHWDRSVEERVGYLIMTPEELQ